MRYAGIGSRSAPLGTRGCCVTVARKMREQGWILRSGGAEGCDTAFAKGAGDQAEIFLPWPDFGQEMYAEPSPWFERPVELPRPSSMALKMVSTFHPAPSRLSWAAKQLHGRNCHIILGRHLDAPVDRVICWTLDEHRGGTSFALRVARAHDIEVHNLADAQVFARYCRT